MIRHTIFFLVAVALSSNIFAQSAGRLLHLTNSFLSTLNSAEKAQVSYDFDDTLRTKWTNLPVGMASRPGIRYGDLSEESRIVLHDILTTLFSSQGYLKTTSIMHLDDYLLQIYEVAHQNKQINDVALNEIKALNWGHGNYYLSIWGTPASSSTWGFKMEGHHISINITIIEGQLEMTPLFLGSDPALVRVNQFAGMRPLSKEEDYGLELMNMLSPEQQRLATISAEFPEDIITSPGNPQRLTEYQGIKGSTFTRAQKMHFEFLILEYVRNFERDKAKYYTDRIAKDGIDDIYFGWIGGMERKTNHYYVINGPDFLIEYDNAGWIYQGDHVHTIFRDKKNDFGEDLLKSHYLDQDHGGN